MKRLLIIPFLIGVGLLVAPYLRPNDARCLHCQREFYAGTGTVMCRVCRHVMDAESARLYFRRRADVPFLVAPTVKIEGPVPPNITER